MRKIVHLAALAFAVLAGRATAEDFTVTSTDFEAGGKIKDAQVFKGFGCSGGNVSPQLAWKNPPEGTKSLAVTVYDPDAPTGSGWWHWIVYNIPPSARELPAGAGDPKKGKLPKGAAQGVTDFGAKGWGGPCPPPGDQPHHYVFTVYALKVPKLQVPPNASGAMVGFNLNANALGKATVTALYGR
jgi:Raf kinase inhibitor-like YbhB/YbcL family protein